MSVPVGDFNVIANFIVFFSILCILLVPMSILSYSENFEPLAASESNRTSKIGRFQIAGGRHLTLLQFMDTHQLLLQFFAVHLHLGQHTKINKMPDPLPLSSANFQQEQVNLQKRETRKHIAFRCC